MPQSGAELKTSHEREAKSTHGPNSQCKHMMLLGPSSNQDLGCGDLHT